MLNAQLKSSDEDKELQVDIRFVKIWKLCAIVWVSFRVE